MKTKKRQSPLAKERAQRIKQLRRFLRYSRQKFSDRYKKYGVTASSLQSWEDIRWNGLTEDGAQKLSLAFQEEGLHVTVEWLLFGVGEDPIGNALPFANATIANIAQPSEKNKIAKELRLLHQHIPDAVDTIIADDGLAPWLEEGDYVAGKRYFDNEIENAIDQICIVQTLAGQILVRKLQSGSEIEHYTLVCTNPNTTQASLKNIKIFSAAPILWIRKS